MQAKEGERRPIKTQGRNEFMEDSDFKKHVFCYKGDGEPMKDFKQKIKIQFCTLESPAAAAVGKMNYKGIPWKAAKPTHRLMQ